MPEDLRYCDKQKTAYEMNLCDWSSDVCSSDLEKEMAPHSSTLAWIIPWMEEPDRLQSMGS